MLNIAPMVMIDSDFFFNEQTNFFKKLSNIFKCTVLDFFGTLNEELVFCPIKLSTIVPTYSYNNATLEELCYIRCRELLSLNLSKYYFCWSGGIDSTLMVISALKYIPHNRVIILYTKESIDEYPLFVKYLTNVASIKIEVNNIPNCQLILGQYVPDHSINENYWLYKLYNINTGIHDIFINESNKFHEYLDRYIEYAYFPIQTLLDLFLYIQLTCKANTEKYIYHNEINFFSTPYFYNFFIQNRYNLFPYKYLMKMEILRYTKDIEYLNKRKVCSILKTSNIDAVDIKGNRYTFSKYNNLSFLQKLKLLSKHKLIYDISNS